jgi:predicted secreted hydrolase
LALLLLLACPASGQDWKPALPGYEYKFPRDHGQHPAQKIEWWYYTGNLATAEGRHFGYQLTFFRIGATQIPANASPWALRDVWMAHFAVSDLLGEKYHHADRLNRAGPGLAGATTERVWNEDWQVRLSTDDKMSLTATDRDFSIQLDLGSGEKPVIHGQDGISQKGITPGNASHYYSLARMPTRGSISVGGETFTVTGESWMDHEFGSSFLEKGTQGWDWFSAQLSDGSELMLFQLRGSAPGSNAGTLIEPDGSVITLVASDFTLTPGTLWKSPTGAQYPITWQIAVPKYQLTLECRAAMPNQEFTADSTPGLSYWEGAVDYTGTSSGKAITGRGYLEMTGYRGQAMSVWFGTGP